MSPAHAALAPVGRDKLVKLVKLVISEGWSTRRAADRFPTSSTTMARRVTSARTGEGLAGCSSRPSRSPKQLTRGVPHRIGCPVKESRSTNGLVRVIHREGGSGGVRYRRGHVPCSLP